MVTSSYRVYGVHPDLVPIAIRKIRKAKLGDEYADLYDENGNLIPPRLDIPDYDPTIPLRRRRQKEKSIRHTVSRKFRAPASVWPDVRRLGPLRHIISREEVKEDGHTWYNELLECGHVYVEFLEWNLSSKRRCCRKCL